MPRLQYDLDKIEERPYEPDVCQSQLLKISKTISRAGNPMLVFTWRILTGPNKDKRIRSYAVLLDGSGGLKDAFEHLAALGVRVKNGRLLPPKDGNELLIGRQARLILTERPTTKEGRTKPFVGVERVLPLDH